MVYEYEIKILEQHLDTFGHVNNANYLVFFEEARWEMMLQLGSNLADVMKSKKGPVILEVNLKFMKELKLRQKAKITTEMIEYKGRVGKLRQCILSLDGELMTEAIFVFGYFDLEARKLISFPDSWVKAFES